MAVHNCKEKLKKIDVNHLKGKRNKKVKNVVKVRIYSIMSMNYMIFMREMTCHLVIHMMRLKILPSIHYMSRQRVDMVGLKESGKRVRRRKIKERMPTNLTISTTISMISTEAIERYKRHD